MLEPIFEKEFLPVSFGFRPQRGCKDALRIVDKGLKDGFTWVVDADLQSYFDTIPKQGLMELVKGRVSDVNGFVRRRLRALLRKREKRPGFGRTQSDHWRWPNAFFAQHGPFTLQEAYVVASQPR